MEVVFTIQSVVLLLKPAGWSCADVGGDGGDDDDDDDDGNGNDVHGVGGDGASSTIYIYAAR